ncbi:MAG TPA: hypothetical protein VGN17_07230 [Bryobacteraceae bacterium]|jgi:hypothetical protein
MRVLIDLLRFVIGYVGLLLVYGGVAAWEAYSKTPMPPREKWIILGAVFLLTTFENWRTQLHKAEAAEARAKETAPEPRAFVEHPQALLERYSDSGPLADKLLIPDLGKWITVTGRFEAVAESLTHDAMHVTLTLDCGRRVHLRFPLEARASLEALREGQQLTAMSQIKQGHALGVYTLDNSEFVRAQPLRSRVTTLKSRSA